MLYGHRPDDLPHSEHSLFSVVAFLPEPLDAVIAPLRQRFDPDYNVVRSRITIVAPFVANRPLVDITEIIREETGRLGNISLQLKIEHLEF